LKTLTAAQLQSRKDQASRFVRDVLGDPERADELEEESLEDYADRRKISIVNQRRSKQNMANGGTSRTKQDLLDEIADLKAENQELQDALDSIADIASPEEEEEDDNGDDLD
jgi:hypothetical protein